MADAFTKIVFIQYCIGINDSFIFKISKLTDLVFHIFFGIAANTLKMVNNVRTVFSFVADSKIPHQFQRSGRIVDFDSEAVCLFGMGIQLKSCFGLFLDPAYLRTAAGIQAED